MNKFINILLGIILIPTLLMTLYVGFDLPVTFLKTTGEYIPYKEYIFLGLGVFIFLLILKRSINRWMGMMIVLNTSKFKWNQAVSSKRKQRVNLYLSLESLVMFCISIALYSITTQAWAPAMAFFIGAVDNIVFAVIGTLKNGYRVALSSKAVIVADREVTLVYFKGLRKVTPHQLSVYFDYIKGLQLNFPLDCIDDENKPEFFKLLEQQFDSDKVFFSKKMMKKENQI